MPGAPSRWCGLLAGLCLTTAGLGVPAARAAPGSRCSAASAKRVAQLGLSAENALAAGQTRQAWRSVRDAVNAARQGGCTGHRSLGRAYLVLGIIQQKNGRRARMLSAWRRALTLDRTLGLDPRFTNPRLRRAFRRQKTALYPATARPRPRPRPRPADPTPDPTPSDPALGTSPRPRPDPTPTPTTTGRAAGCGTDRDCKGNRVCEQGRCVYAKDRRVGVVVVTPTAQRHAAAPAPTPAPAVPKGKQRYSDKGVVELGLGIGLQYSEIKEKQDGNEYKVNTLYFDFDLYLAYFVAHRFKLGFHFSIPISKAESGDVKVLTWEIDLLGAPGFTFPFSSTVFGFIDFLFGFAARGNDIQDAVDDKLILGVVGGELGFKIVLGTHMLMKIGLRPMYLFGKTEVDSSYHGEDTIDVSDVRVILTLGFAGFW